VQRIARHALAGRVRELLVADSANLWGVLHRASGEVELHEDGPRARDDDVLDDLAEAVLLRGGEVLTLNRERMPNRSPVAAILRW